MSHEFIAACVLAHFEEQFGVPVGPAHGESFSSDRNGQRHFFRMEIKQDFGIFSMVIKKAQVHVAFEKSQHNGETRYWVPINLGYEHPGGGSNGSSIGTMWFNEAGDLIECSPY